MPKFYGQNKKRIDPRYFLDETTHRDIDEIRSTTDRGESETMYTDQHRSMSDMDFSSVTTEESELLKQLKKELDESGQDIGQFLRGLSHSRDRLDAAHPFVGLINFDFEVADIKAELEALSSSSEIPDDVEDKIRAVLNSDRD